MLHVLADGLNDFRKVVSAAGNAVAASFPSRVPTTTEPTAGDTVDGSSNVGGAVLDIAPALTGAVWSHMVLLPYGGDANNETMLIRVLGWAKYSTLWVPVPLAQVTCTLSSAVPGVNGSVIEDELFFADTIVKTLPASGDTDAAAAVSPATDSLAGIGHLKVKVKGFRKLEILFDRNSSAASCNALYKLY